LLIGLRLGLPLNRTTIVTNGVLLWCLTLRVVVLHLAHAATLTHAAALLATAKAAPHPVNFLTESLRWLLPRRLAKTPVHAVRPARFVPWLLAGLWFWLSARCWCHFGSLWYFVKA
jgi:hypothetical protein